MAIFPPCHLPGPRPVNHGDLGCFRGCPVSPRIGLLCYRARYEVELDLVLTFFRELLVRGGCACRVWSRQF